jgi:hypothetical protein
MSESMTPQQAEQEAERIITAAFRFRDDTPPVPTGAQPVMQPETRIVPAWAVGTAVASVGIGAGATGLGCAAWLALQGLASVTVTGVAFALAPFLGVAAVVLAVGAALNRAKSTETTNVYTGPVTKHTEIHSETRGAFARSRTEVQS